MKSQERLDQGQKYFQKKTGIDDERISQVAIQNRERVWVVGAGQKRQVVDVVGRAFYGRTRDGQPHHQSLDIWCLAVGCKGKGGARVVMDELAAGEISSPGGGGGGGGRPLGSCNCGRGMIWGSDTQTPF